MFVGELPELEEAPFKGLKEIVFEGRLSKTVGRCDRYETFCFANSRQLSFLLKRFLLKCCDNVRDVRLHTSKHFSTSIMSALADLKRTELSELHLSLEHVDSDFLPLLSRIVETSPILKRLEVLSYDNNIRDGLDSLGVTIRSRNWDVSYLHHVKRRPMTRI